PTPCTRPRTNHRRALILVPVQNHLARTAGHHGLEATLEFCVVEAVGDHRTDIEPGLQHDCHLVPCLVHLAAVNALDREHVEDHRAPVDSHFAGRDAEDGDPGAVAHI